MSNVVNRRICLTCKYRGRVYNSTHTSCLHPDIRKMGVKKAALNLRIEAAFFGIMKGWFTWPFDFDSIWLTNCEGMVENDSEDKK